MSYILDKVKSNIKKYGYIKAFKRMGIKVSHIIKTKLFQIINKKNYINELNEIIKLKKYKNIIVQYPFFDFNMPNFQRFQQLAIAMSKVEDTLVFYCTPNNIYDSVYGFKKYDPNLYITNQYNLILNSKLDNVTVIFVSTDTRFLFADIENVKAKGYNVIYDFVDDINEDIVGKSSNDIMQRHIDILKDESIKVVATAQLLLNEVQKYRTSNYLLAGNGVNIEDFCIDENSQEYADELNNTKMKEVLNLKSKTKIVIGYYGALATWFDYELVKYIAKNKDIGVLLIGINYDQSLDKANLGQFDNISYIGAVEYKKIKYYANMCDILTIPFKVNDITNSTSPVKLYEYMALSKPIIVTAMYECSKYASVTVVNSKEEFVERIYDVLKNNNFDSSLMHKEASENTWESKAISILSSKS